MAQAKINYFIVFLLLLSACAKKSDLTPDNDQISSGIMGGVNVDSKFQNDSGVVGLVLVGKSANGSTSTAICTGSLIASNVVLSAGHCVASSPDFKLIKIYVIFAADISTVAGEMKANNRDHVRDADAVIQHENFGFDKTNGFILNDLSLIRFVGSAPTGFNTTKMADSALFNSLQAGVSLSLSGYGVTSYNLDSATKKAVGDGSGILRNIDNRKIYQVSQDRSKILFKQTDNNGACHGDSGGPAFYTDSVKNQKYIVGVTSQGYWLDSKIRTGDPLCNQINVYTNLANYTDWINLNLKAIQSK